MARFINRQEEVIQIELTPHGKNSFSQGRFLPRYYAFFDDDVLYDQGFRPSGSIQRTNPKVDEENQNDIVDRVKEVPRLEIYSDRGMTRNYRNFEARGETSPQQRTTNIANPTPNAASPVANKFLKPLGTSSPVHEYAPSWKIKTMGDSEPLSVSGTEDFPHRSGASGSSVIIPYFSASLPLDYDVSTMTVNLDADGRVIEEGGQETEQKIWGIVKDGRLLLDVKEINTMFKGNGNFDIEVFRKQQEGRQTTFQQLMFINNEFQDADRMRLQEDPDIYSRLLQGDDQLIGKKVPKLNTEHVEYFLSVRVDDEIEDLEAQPEAGETLFKTATTSDPVDPCEE